MKKLFAVGAALLVCAAASGAVAATPSAAIGPPSPTPFAFPLNVVSVDQGSFTGVFKVERFAVHNGALVASGAVMGTRVDAAGVISSVYRTVTIPVILPTAAKEGPLGCDILHLELGPLDLDLLGLVVHLNRIVLDIDAEPGAGNLLGNLLCAIVGLLDGSNLSQLANLLNQLLSILG